MDDDWKYLGHFDSQLEAVAEHSGSWWFLTIGGRHVAMSDAGEAFYKAIAARLNEAPGEAPDVCDCQACQERRRNEQGT